MYALYGLQDVKQPLGVFQRFHFCHSGTISFLTA